MECMPVGNVARLTLKVSGIHYKLSFPLPSFFLKASSLQTSLLSCVVMLWMQDPASCRENLLYVENLLLLLSLQLK